MMLPLKARDTKGRLIILTRPGLEDTSTTSLDLVTRACMMILDTFIEEEEEVSITGVTFLEDMKEITMAHAISFTPVMAKKMMTLFQVQINPLCCGNKL